jgi:hypothetical protein
VTPEESFAAFSAHVHRLCPEGGFTAALFEPLPIRDRVFCGEHGRQIPNRHGRCIECDGYAEPIDEKKAVLIRDLWRELQAM